jgi:hypothetical protein
MLKTFLHGIASIGFFAVFVPPPLSAQQLSMPAPTIRVQSSLVLVDVFSQDRKSGLPTRDFNKEDFRLFDNGREVRITTFDAGERYDTRAITLWLVVICNEGGLPKLGASAEFLGQESLFRLHSIILRATTAWELLIGATTVTADSICCRQKTAIRLSKH